MSSEQISLKEICGRYRKLYGGPIYDVLEQAGYPNQVLAKEIRPLRSDMKVAGPAFTVKSILSPGRWYGGPKRVDLIGSMTPHCVAVYDPGREDQSGHWGEQTSNAAAAKGCQGVVVDGGARDSTQHLAIENWSCFCRFTSPIEAGSRLEMIDIQKPILMSGSLTSVVPVRPGDFVFGDLDGVIIIPKEIAVEVLLKAEEIVSRENKAREELRRGVPREEVMKKYKVG